MIKASLKNAKGDLEHLVDEAQGGEEVILIRGDGARFRIVPLEPETPPSVVGNSLDHLIGSWSEAEEAEFLKAIEVFEEIDGSLWQADSHERHLGSVASDRDTVRPTFLR